MLGRVVGGIGWHGIPPSGQGRVPKAVFAVQQANAALDRVAALVQRFRTKREQQK
jgi:hypothetical protein